MIALIGMGALALVLNGAAVGLLIALLILHVIDRKPDLYDVCDCAAYDGHEPHCAVYGDPEDDDIYQDIEQDEEK